MNEGEITNKKAFDIHTGASACRRTDIINKVALFGVRESLQNSEKQRMSEYSFYGRQEYATQASTQASSQKSNWLTQRHQAPKNGGGFLESSSSQDKTQKKTDNGQSVTPCTLKQLKRAVWDFTIEKFTLDNHTLNVITLVGRVYEINTPYETYNAFELEDGTGSIGCRHWHGNNPRPPPIKDDYYRVFGLMQSLNGNRTMILMTYYPITDHNETTWHFLNVIQTWLKIKKGYSAPPPKVVQTNSGGDEALSALILKTIADDGNRDGVHFNVILGRLGITDEKKVLQEIRDLQESGRIYSTLDDFTFSKI